MGTIIFWLILGAIAGWLAGKITRGGGFGPLGNIVVGVVGSMIGGTLSQTIGLTSTGFVGSLISAFVGACLFLYLLEMIPYRRLDNRLSNSGADAQHRPSTSRKLTPLIVGVNSTKWDIFLSYAREDAVRVAALVLALEKAGLSIFWDHRVRTGQKWRSQIDEALEQTNCVVVAWSKDSIQSEWVIEEAEDGKRRGVLMPILLDPVQPPRGFREIHATDLSTWRLGAYSEAFDILLSELRTLLKSRE